MYIKILKQVKVGCQLFAIKEEYTFCWSDHFGEFWGRVIDVYWEEE